MDHFQYTDGELRAEAVPIRRIAADVGTPFYCYSTATLERHYRVFAEAVGGLDATICYAVKANSNLAVIATLARLGSGADVVSGGELKRALVARVAASKIVFSGIGKTASEMAAALKAGVMQINVESVPELETLSGVASSLGIDTNVAIRVNPDVDALTHEKIATGKSENKFGIDWQNVPGVYRHARRCRAFGSPASPSTSARRFSTWRLFGKPMGVLSNWSGRSRPTATPSKPWTWAAAWAFPMRTNNRRVRRNMATWSPPWSAVSGAGSFSSRAA